MSGGTSGEEDRASESWWAALEGVKAEVQSFKSDVKGQLDDGALRMTRIEAGQAVTNQAVAENTKLTQTVVENTTAIAEFMATLKGLLKFGNFLSVLTTRIWKPASLIAMTVAAAAAAWVSIKTGLGIK